MMNINSIYELYKLHPLITTDSRQCAEGSIFLALKGELFNGNLFAAQALRKGCAYAIVSENHLTAEEQAELGERIIMVDDTLQTYKDLARLHRREYDIPVIGITGTNGKTTTKELIAAVLQSQYRVLYTQGNFNNDVGVPKTLFGIAAEHDMAVIEMGASHPGDIKTLVETAEPTCALITNVGRAHLQGFGSFEGVKQTKGEMYDFIASHGRFAFLNTNDSDLVNMAEERHVSTIAYANGRVKSCSPMLCVELDGGLCIKTQLIGAYNLPNVLAAVTIGRHFNIADEQIKTALEAYAPSNNRSQFTVTEENDLIVDAYNANPTSMAAAIENFRQMDTAKAKLAILGGMKELGDASQSEHEKIVKQLIEVEFPEVWLVGSEFAFAQDRFRWFENVEEVKREIAQNKPAKRCILIKGSNSQKLYQLPEEL